MGVDSYERLLSHVGHKFECVTYGPNNENVALECVTCSEVMMDFDKPLTDEARGKKLHEIVKNFKPKKITE